LALSRVASATEECELQLQCAESGDGLEHLRLQCDCEVPRRLARLRGVNDKREPALVRLRPEARHKIGELPGGSRSRCHVSHVYDLPDVPLIPAISCSRRTLTRDAGAQAHYYRPCHPASRPHGCAKPPGIVRACSRGIFWRSCVVLASIVVLSRSHPLAAACPARLVRLGARSRSQQFRGNASIARRVGRAVLIPC